MTEQFGHPKGSTEWSRELASHQKRVTTRCKECGKVIQDAKSTREFCKPKCRQANHRKKRTAS